MFRTKTLYIFTKNVWGFGQIPSTFFRENHISFFTLILSIIHTKKALLSECFFIFGSNVSIKR